MPLLLVLILVLIAFALLLISYLTSSPLWSWVSVLVSVVALIVLFVDFMLRRSAVRAGDDVRAPSDGGVRAADRAAPAAAPAAPAVRAGGPTHGVAAPVPPPFRPVGPRPTGPADPATEIIRIVRPEGRDPGADVEQTVVMPIVRPSGSPIGPSGAAEDIPPSREFTSRSVTTGGVEERAPDAEPSDPAGASAVRASEAVVVEPAAAADPTTPDPATPDTVAPDTARDDRPAAVPVEDPDGEPDAPASDATRPEEWSAEPASSAAPPDDGPTAPPPDGPPALSPPGSGSSAGSSGAGSSGAGSSGAGSSAGSGTGPDPVDPGAADGSDVPLAEALPVQVPVTAAEPPVEPHDADAAALVARLEDEVIVIDERPRYHVPGCRTLLAAAIIPLPVREAVELGFSPCGWCTPDRTLAAQHAPARS